MAKQVKVIWIINETREFSGYIPRDRIDGELTELVNQGWVIIAVAGGGGTSGGGFIVLQKEEGQ